MKDKYFYITLYNGGKINAYHKATMYIIDYLKNSIYNDKDDSDKEKQDKMVFLDKHIKVFRTVETPSRYVCNRENVLLQSDNIIMECSITFESFTFHSSYETDFARRVDYNSDYCGYLVKNIKSFLDTSFNNIYLQYKHIKNIKEDKWNTGNLTISRAISNINLTDLYPECSIGKSDKDVYGLSIIKKFNTIKREHTDIELDNRHDDNSNLIQTMDAAYSFNYPRDSFFNENPYHYREPIIHRIRLITERPDSIYDECDFVKYLYMFFKLLTYIKGFGLLLDIKIDTDDEYKKENKYQDTKAKKRKKKKLNYNIRRYDSWL